MWVFVCVCVVYMHALCVYAWYTHACVYMKVCSVQVVCEVGMCMYAHKYERVFICVSVQYTYVWMYMWMCVYKCVGCMCKDCV